MRPSGMWFGFFLEGELIGHDVNRGGSSELMPAERRHWQPSGLARDPRYCGVHFTGALHWSCSALPPCRALG